MNDEEELTPEGQEEEDSSKSKEGLTAEEIKAQEQEEEETEEKEQEVVELGKYEEERRARQGSDRRVTKLTKILSTILGSQEGGEVELGEGGIEVLADKLGISEPQESDELLELSALRSAQIYFAKSPDSKVPTWLREEIISEPLRFADLHKDVSSEDVKESIQKTLRRYEVRFGGTVPEEARGEGVKVITSVKEKLGGAETSNAERIVSMVREGKQMEVEQLLASGTFADKDLDEAVLLEEEAKKRK